jgi:hypothetical protein
MHYREVDRRRKADQAYAKTPERRKKRAMNKLDTINTAWRLETTDKRKGHTYESGMAGPTATERTTEETMETEDGVVVPVVRLCRACGNCGHQQRTSKLCTKNPCSLQYDGT